MLEVLGKASSINVRKVLWTCAELGIAFKSEDWGSGFRSTQEKAFLALNPNAMVPVIREDEFVLWESNAIIRYLTASHGGNWLYPSTPRLRAMIDQWIDWQASDLNRAWSYAFQALVRRSPDHQDTMALDKSSSDWSCYMTILNQQLERTGAFIAGSDFSLADIPIGLSVNRWFQTPLDHPALPAVTAYYERLTDRPGYNTYGRNGIP
jgi:glutathione S-transferase